MPAYDQWMDPKEIFLTPDDVAQRWNVSGEFVRSACRAGRLPAKNIGGKKRPTWRIRQADLEAYERQADNQARK